LENTLETKDEVFYVRCRPKIKQMIFARMQADGFESMADWFEQFVSEQFSAKKKKVRKK